MRHLTIGPNITCREAASLNQYLNDINKIELLTLEEEIALAKKIKNGDQSALERMTKCNLRFVVSVAKQYQNYGLSLGDLIAEGNLGLIKAASRFDETKGFKFISYAVWPIRHSIIFAITDQVRTIRIPQSMLGSLSKINKTVSVLQQELERNPSAAEISQQTDMNEDKIKDCLDNTGFPVSLNSIMDHEIGLTLLDVLKSDVPDTDNILMQESMNEHVHSILKTLSRREREVLELFFGLGKMESVKLEDIAARYELSKERIRQIKDKAIKQLRRMSETHLKRTGNF